jgi:excisionase family DNA binding protein
MVKDKTGRNGYFSISEVSQMTGIKQPKIIRYIRKGVITAKKIGWVWVVTEEEIKKLKSIGA